MAHTRVYPMDSQRYDMTKREHSSTTSNPISTTPRRAGISPTFVQRCPLFSRIDSQRFDPLARPSIRPRRSFGSSGIMMPNTLPMSKPRRPLRLLSHMDSQRYDPSLKSKPFHNLTANAALRDNTTGIAGNILSPSLEPIVRVSDDLSTLTDGSLGTTHDGIFESRSNFASSTTSVAQFSDTSTPRRTERDPHPTDEEHEFHVVAKSRTHSFYILKTPPPCARFLCGLDCRNSTLTTFDLVQPPESSNVIPSVIRLP